MILKIKKEDGWIFVSNIRKAEIQNKDKKLREVHEIGIPIVIIASEKNVNTTNLYIKTNDNREENYIIDSEVYLLNDEGKTIERIN